MLILSGLGKKLFSGGLRLEEEFRFFFFFFLSHREQVGWGGGGVWCGVTGGWETVPGRVLLPEWKGIGK